MTVSDNVQGANEDSKTPSPKEETNPGKDFMEAKNITDNDNLKKPMNEVSYLMSKHLSKLPKYFSLGYANMAK